MNTSINLDEIKFTPLIETLKLENIDDAIYFSEKYSGYISNSRLGLINPDQDGSPEKYFKGFPKTFSDSFLLGSAVHGLTLQPEAYIMIDTVNRPTAKVGFIADLVVKKLDNFNSPITDEMLIEAAKEVDYYHGELDEKKLSNLREKVTHYVYELNEFYQYGDSEGKETIFLDEKSRDKVRGIVSSLHKNPLIHKLLNPTGLLEEPISGNERTILLDVKVDIPGKESFIIRLKSKLDNFTIDKENNTIYVNDVKTTSKKTTEFGNAVKDYHYYREISMYAYLLSLVAKKYYGLENPIIKGNFLVVSTFGDYYTTVVPMTNEDFKKGFNEFKNLTKMVAYYTANPEQIKAECMTL